MKRPGLSLGVFFAYQAQSDTNLKSRRLKLG